MLKLYVGTFCPFCKKVESYMNEAKVTDVEIINVDEDKNAREELIEKGGKRQVPALSIDGKIMYESDDIIEYLKNRA